MRIELEEVHHLYAAGTSFEVAALRGVSLAVEPGEVLAIVGGTGSGKSTLVQHLNLLVRPTRGRVLIDGEDAAGMKLASLRRRVGLVFQFPEAQLFESSVREDVAFAPRKLGLDEEEVERRVVAALEELDLCELAERSPFALSGGERRRAAIAGVLAMEPEVLVLDEPTAALDPASRGEMLEIMRRFRRGRGCERSVVLVSHDLDEVAEVAVIGLPDERWIEAVTAVVVLKEGAELTAETVRAHVKERLAGFKVPKRVDFVAELPRNQSGKLLKRALRAERTQEAR